MTLTKGLLILLEMRTKKNVPTLLKKLSIKL